MSAPDSTRPSGLLGATAPFGRRLLVWVLANTAGAVLITAGVLFALEPRPLVVADVGRLLLAIALALAFATLLSHRRLDRILRPLASIADVAKAMGDGGAHGRRAVAGDDRETAAFVGAFNTMLDEMETRAAALKTSEAEARARAEELRSILAVTPAAIWIARDTECRVITGSRFAHEILQQPLGANLSKTAPPGEAPSNFRVFDVNGREIPPEHLPLQTAARTGQPVTEYREYVEFDDGTRRVLFGNAMPTRDADGNVTGAVAAFIDISALDAADRQKNEFLATLAHELRNPMAPIRYATALLKAGAPASTVEQARQIIDRQSAQMARLLDDLLDMSRITRNVVELKRSRVDLRTVVRDALDAIGPSAAAQHHAQDAVLPDAAAWVDGDPARLLQIVGNLLSNAVKYTPAGGRIATTLELRDADVRLIVRDTGIGLAPSMIPRVFDLFSQVHKGTGTAHEGLGIGLAVVKRLVDLHGGTIEAKSEGLGYGAEFVVTLPRVIVAGAESTAATAAVTSLYRRQPRVLVVDDNRDAADSLALLLRMNDVAVHVAYGGEQALALADAVKPDVAVLDLGMPRVGGEEVAIELRKRPWAAGLRIVALTGWGLEADRARTRAAGFDLHLVKPVTPEVLLAAVGEGTAEPQGVTTASRGI
jgi:signal transduction histidine kinase/ActR/RegA family two-component response regulator/HAMP domain-containing protein